MWRGFNVVVVVVVVVGEEEEDEQLNVFKKFLSSKMEKYIHNTWGDWENQTSPPTCISHFPNLFARLVVVIQRINCVLCWLPTVATRVQSYFKSCGIRG
jgi:hypothetical protein